MEGKSTSGRGGKYCAPNSMVHVHTIIRMVLTMQIYHTLHVFICSSPLKVSLGNKLNITCPVNATSNIWIQVSLLQLESNYYTVLIELNAACNSQLLHAYDTMYSCSHWTNFHSENCRY